MHLLRTGCFVTLLAAFGPLLTDARRCVEGSPSGSLSSWTNWVGDSPIRVGASIRDYD
jgi:hypothetical protein